MMLMQGNLFIESGLMSVPSRARALSAPQATSRLDPSALVC